MYCAKGPRLVAASGLVVMVLALGACGGSISVKPAAGSRGRVDDPRTTQTNHVKCLRDKHLSVQEVGRTGLQIGAAPAGPRVVFAPTPGAAQYDQMSGNSAYQGAEVIGSALLYPNQGSESELNTVEDCLAKGVTG
jgi:hypothetical protein